MPYIIAVTRDQTDHYLTARGGWSIDRRKALVAHTRDYAEVLAADYPRARIVELGLSRWDKALALIMLVISAWALVLAMLAGSLYFVVTALCCAAVAAVHLRSLSPKE